MNFDAQQWKWKRGTKTKYVNFKGVESIKPEDRLDKRSGEIKGHGEPALRENKHLYNC